MKRATGSWPPARLCVLLLALPVLVGDTPVSFRMPGRVHDFVVRDQVARIYAGRGGRAGTGLEGSPHDFSKPGNRLHLGDRKGDRCVFCHVAEDGSVPVDRTQWLSTSTSAWEASTAANRPQARGGLDSLPLWNHKLTYASYTMYQNGPGAPHRGAKASQAMSYGGAPGSSSLVCLGCHDGSVAFNVIGKDNYLGNHHPIGFDYDAVRAADKEIRPAEIAYLTQTTTVRDHLYGPGNARMECGTCHSVHNTGNSGESLLWRSDFRSSLCLTCHDKGTYPSLP